MLNPKKKEVITMSKSYHLFWGIVCIVGTIMVFLLLATAAPSHAGEKTPILQKYTGTMQLPPQIVTIHPETTFQAMDGFGVGFSGAIINRMPEGAYDLLYNPNNANGAHLNIVRLLVSYTAQLQKLNTKGLSLYNWEADNETKTERDAINNDILPLRKQTKTFIYAVPFTPPIDWKTCTSEFKFNPLGECQKVKQKNGCSTTIPKSACGGILDPKHYDDYAGYLADFVAYFNSNGIPIDVLSLQNEPNACVKWPSCFWTGDMLKNFLINYLYNKINTSGLSPSPLLMLPEGSHWGVSWDLLSAALYDANASPLMGNIASHSYEGNGGCVIPVTTNDDQGRQNFAGAGKKVWMSEMAVDDTSPDKINASMKLAQIMQNDLVNAHASAWIYCFAIGDRWGLLLSPNGGSLKIPKRFYTMANYTRFIEPGWKLMSVDRSFAGMAGKNTDTTAFINPADGSFVIVALNAGGNDMHAVYAFDDWTIFGEVKAYRTDDHDLNLASVASPTIDPQSHQFTATLPPMSVTTFTGRLLNICQLDKDGTCIKPKDNPKCWCPLPDKPNCFKDHFGRLLCY